MIVVSPEIKRPQKLPRNRKQKQKQKMFLSSGVVKKVGRKLHTESYHVNDNEGRCST